MNYIQWLGFFFLVNIQIGLSQNKWDSAFQFSTTVTGDFIYNFQGGLKQSYTYLGMEDIALEFDTEVARLWKNGTFFLHGLNTHGIGPSAELTGDLQVFSNIEAGDYTGLYEFWYQHRFGSFSVLIGQHDLNTEFAGTHYGGTFINSSFGIVPSISLNVPVSIYPVSAPCLLVKYESNDKIAYKLAFYDGNPGDIENNRFGLNWNFSSEEGVLSIGEIEYFIKKKEQIIGNIKAGCYFHSGTFLNYADTFVNKKGNWGFYMITDQNLFPRSLNKGRGLCFFFQGGYAPSSYNMINYYIGGGFRYHGILPYRFYDELGLALAHIKLSDKYKALYNYVLNYETSIELTYLFKFGGRYSIQPSVQYIINPGASKEISNCFVGLMRFSLTY